MSISNIGDKIKGMDDSSKERLFVICLIILVGVGAFGLGRLSVVSFQKTPVRIEDGVAKNSQNGLNTSQSQTVTPEVKGESIVASNRVFASKTGNIYYTLDCSSGSRVSEKNKIWFDSVADAEKFGLKPGCK